jgi:hypothetical protein
MGANPLSKLLTTGLVLALSSATEGWRAVCGDVRNVGQVPVRSVAIRVQGLDSAGQVVSTRDRDVMAGVPAGSRAHHLGELFPRVGFIVTTLTGTNRAVVRFYNQRRTAEQWIKDWTRLSCHRFRANELRLLLGVIAYNLGNLLRRLALPVAIQSWSLTSLPQRLFSRPAGG